MKKMDPEEQARIWETERRKFQHELMNISSDINDVDIPKMTEKEYENLPLHEPKTNKVGELFKYSETKKNPGEVAWVLEVIKTTGKGFEYRMKSVRII